MLMPALGGNPVAGLRAVPGTRRRLTIPAAQLPDHSLLPFVSVAGTADAGRQPTRPLARMAWQRYKAWVTQPDR
jgi:hypothetical protein